MTATSVRPRIAVLLACHNRRELTLRALRSITTSDGGFDLTSVLLDDNSTDGTADAVRAEFPATIIVRGDGASFWNGGMHLAWRRALALQPDGYLWLNDDVALDPDAIGRLAEQWAQQGGRSGSEPFILVGATRGSNGALTYGGMMRERSPFAFRVVRQPIAEEIRRVDTFNGNIVLISRGTVERIGINDPAFFHAMGDVDYGLRATAAGIPVLLMPGTMGVCELNRPVEYLGLSFVERWRHMKSHRGLPFASWWRLTRRHSGFWALPHFLLPYRRLFYPQTAKSTPHALER